MASSDSRAAGAVLGCVLAALAGLPVAALAADWVTIQGTEQGRPEQHLAPFGFIQVVGEGVLADEVDGLQDPALQPFEGEHAAFNTVSPEGAHTSFAIRRARVGVRGTIPNTERRVSYAAAVEYGMNSATSGSRVALLDASATLRVLGGLHVRAGQFKVPTMDETLEAVHRTTDFVANSLLATRLMAQRDMLAGTVKGPGCAWRDVGVQAFQAFQLAGTEVSWAAMVADGRMGAPDDNSAKDVIARLQLAWFVDPAKRHAPERDELAVWAWGWDGPRDVGDAHVRRVRAGGGFQVREGRLRVVGEGVYANGALAGEAAAPFPGQAAPAIPWGTAYGALLSGGYRVLPRLELDLRAEGLRHEPGEGPAERRFWAGTAGAQWFFSPDAKVMANVGYTHMTAPDGSADTTRILDTSGLRVAFQATVAF